MSLPNYLSKIKSSGCYRYVFDKSEIPQEERSSLRLVVGYSERGPFNTPVYIADAAEFVSTFGNISRRMERKGIFFHRMAIQALEAGPILALNLKPFSSETAKMLTFNASDIKMDESGIQPDLKADLIDDALVALEGSNAPYQQFNTIFDTNRFWKVTDNLMNILPVNADGSPGTAKTDYMRIVQTSSKEDSVTIFIRPYVPTGYDVKISDWYSSETAEEMPSYMEAIRDHMLSEFFCEIYVFRGDFRSSALFSYEGTLGSFKRGSKTHSADDWMPFCTVKDADGNDSAGADVTVRTNADYKDSFGNAADALEAMSDVDTSNFIGKYQGIMFPSFKDTNGSFISIDSVFNADYTAHKCLMTINEAILDDAYEADLDYNGEYNDGEVVETNPNAATETIAGLLHSLCSSTHEGDSVDFNEYTKQDVPVNASVVGYYLEGYQYVTIRKNESGQALIQDKIDNVLAYKGMYEALTNNVDIDYKYWVDTFQAYPGVAMKSNVTAMVKKKFNALAILNFPPMLDCAIAMGYPGLEGGFDMKKVVARDSGISLPSEVQGASWAAYYTQLKMTDGTNSFIIPSAALVSNLFMEKWSTRLPYNIVAGPNYGRINYTGVVGPDYNYARADLDALEPFGVNCIIYIPRKGIVINSNQTAKQTPVSALSKVHIRELVTYLQDTIEDMLYGYQWELNTSTLRDKIKAKADTILGLIQANGGIYDFRTKCDDENNTVEMIDNELVLLDLEIEPARGAGKMVQTLTIHRTGGIAASPRN